MVFGARGALLLVVQCSLLLGQNIVQHPRMPVELGISAELSEVSKNYYVIKHRDARTPEQTPRIHEKEKLAQILGQERADQEKQLKSHYLLRDFYFPKGSANASLKYRFDTPIDFMVGLIVDPCKGKGPNCCMDKYGMPEYRVATKHLGDPDFVIDDFVTASHSTLRDEFNRSLDNQFSRRADDHTQVNQTCLSDGFPYSECVGDVRQSAKPDLRSRQEKVVAELLPDCWDHNNTVGSGVNCTSPDGKLHPSCMAVAYAQNAFVFVCGGQFKDDASCGTFLEVHLTPSATFMSKDVHVYEHYLVLPIQCPGFTCVEIFSPGSRFEVKDSASEKTGHNLQGPLTVMKSVEMNKYGRPCDRQAERQGLDLCTETWIFWREKVTGPGYHACSLLYEDDLVRYADMDHAQRKDFHRPRRCSIEPGEETIEPLFIRGGEASIFKIAGDEEVLAETRITSPRVNGFQTTTISTLYREKDMEALQGSLRQLWGSRSPKSNPTDVFAQGENLPQQIYDHMRLDQRAILCARNYELWWVQRAPSEHVVMKRKGFRVTAPKCLFDRTNDRYLSYAFISQVANVTESEHVVKDIFQNNNRQWHLPGKDLRLLNSAGIPQYSATNPMWAKGSPNWNKGIASPQHKAHIGDFFFDH